MKIYLLNLIKRKKFWIFFNRIEQTNNYIHRKDLFIWYSIAMNFRSFEKIKIAERHEE